MAEVGLRELRQNASEIIRRVEIGETITVTVSGRPAAELRPIGKQRWLSGPELAEVWRGPAPTLLGEDLTHLGGDLEDPFER